MKIFPNPRRLQGLMKKILRNTNFGRAKPSKILSDQMWAEILGDLHFQMCYGG